MDRWEVKPRYDCRIQYIFILNIILVLSPKSVDNRILRGKASSQAPKFPQKLGKIVKVKWNKNLYPQSHFHDLFEMFLLFEKVQRRE